MRSPLTLVRKAAQRHSREDPVTSTVRATPWRWRRDDGLYIGWDRTVWLYRQLPLHPLDAHWEDPSVRLEVGSRLEQLLIELGEQSKTSVTGLRQFADYREVHLVSVKWEQLAQIPPGTPPGLAAFFERALRFFVPHKAVFLGVRLRPSAPSGTTAGWKQLNKVLHDLFEQALGEDLPDLGPYESDYQAVKQLIGKFGAVPPNPDELRYLEAWYNGGHSPAVLMVEDMKQLIVGERDTISMVAVSRFHDVVKYAPDFQWIQEAEAHHRGPLVTSVRGRLEPGHEARRRIRKAQRRLRSALEEETATGDLEKPELAEQLQMAGSVETLFMSGDLPLLTDTSIVFGHRVSGDEENYRDWLAVRRGIETEPLVFRQVAALEETLPTSRKRVTPFLQDVSPSMLAYSGITGFSALGDPRGVFVGLTHPNYTPCFLDPFGAPAGNLPPSMAVFGDPGSGKTFLCQLIAFQASLARIPVVFINPKGFDTLKPLADLVGGSQVQVSRLEQAGGYFDPFRFARDPLMAAEIATSHILSTLTGLDESAELELGYGLRVGAERGARCVKEALQAVRDPEVRDLVLKQTMTSSLFALGVGLDPKPRLSVSDALQLIEFDRKLALPDPTKAHVAYTREERIATGAIRLVTRAAMEMLSAAHGGILILDEAWNFLGHPVGIAALQQLGREGRSLNVLPIFATQRVADLLDKDMEGFLSRVFVLSLRDRREAEAALRLCGLDPSEDRLQWLLHAGPSPADPAQERPERWAMALHRDLQNRHAAVLIGPVPPEVRLAFTTNPAERERLAAAQGT